MKNMVFKLGLQQEVWNKQCIIGSDSSIQEF